MTTEHAASSQQPAASSQQPAATICEVAQAVKPGEKPKKLLIISQYFSFLETERHYYQQLGYEPIPVLLQPPTADFMFQAPTVLKRSGESTYGITRGVHNDEEVNKILNEMKPDAVLIHKCPESQSISTKSVADVVRAFNPNVPCLIQQVTGRKGPVRDEDGYKVVDVPDAGWAGPVKVNMCHGEGRPEDVDLAELNFLFRPKGKYFEARNHGSSAVEIFTDPNDERFPFNPAVDEYLKTRLVKGRTVE